MARLSAGVVAQRSARGHAPCGGGGTSPPRHRLDRLTGANGTLERKLKRIERISRLNRVFSGSTQCRRWTRCAVMGGRQGMLGRGRPSIRSETRCTPLVIPCRGGIPRAAAASRALSSSPTCGHGGRGRTAGQRDGMPDPGVPCTCAAHPRTRAARPSQSPYLSRPSDSGLERTI